MSKTLKITAILLLLTSVIVWASVKSVHTIDAETCIGCGECAAVCEFDAISEGEVDGKDVYIIDPVKCTNCGECAEVCPTDAISEVEVEVAVKAEVAKK